LTSGCSIGATGNLIPVIFAIALLWRLADTNAIRPERFVFDDGRVFEAFALNTSTACKNPNNKKKTGQFRPKGRSGFPARLIQPAIGAIGRSTGEQVFFAVREARHPAWAVVPGVGIR
jgi:hypothetical protein